MGREKSCGERFFGGISDPDTNLDPIADDLNGPAVVWSKPTPDVWRVPLPDPPADLAPYPNIGTARGDPGRAWILLSPDSVT